MSVAGFPFRGAVFAVAAQQWLDIFKARSVAPQNGVHCTSAEVCRMWVAWLLCVLGVQASTLDIASVRMAQVIDGRVNIALATDKDDLTGIRWRRSGSED